MARLSGYKYGTVIRYKNPQYERQKEHFENAQEYIDIEKKVTLWKRHTWVIISDGIGKGLTVNTRYVPKDYEVIKEK